jgi:import receptor subunit TOM70
LKAKGNSFFSSKKYQDAIVNYTQAILFKPDPIFYSNRAACYANLGKVDEVIADCNEALKLDSTYIKALNRRAQALEKKGKLSDSLYGKK